MAIYKATTSSTCICEYKIEANSIEEAQDKFYQGDFKDCKDKDFKDEILEEVILCPSS
tara:strand:+ start:1170 stop:1343 length:174 start_codon:yes stop_codon:yes gene_type:complete